MKSETLLVLKNVCKDYGGLRAVDNVSLTVPEGKIVGLIGPNGSGKSTLINLIAGTTDVTGGEIWFDGKNVTTFSPDRLFQQGIVRGYQDPSLFFRMTVLDNALLPVKSQTGEKPWYAPWRRRWKHEETANTNTASEILEQVLLHDQYGKLASDLSGGQMKLLEIARALMGDPRLLLLDEPTAGVAPKLAYDIFKQIARLRDQYGITFLIVEHRLEILFDFVDYVYVMHMGKLLTQGSAMQVAENQTVREVYFGE